MSVLLNSAYHQQYDHNSRGIHQQAMTISYPDHSSPYGLITPPSEMRSTIDIGSDSSTVAGANILVPSANSRYYLRKQSVPQTFSYPVVNNNYQNNIYNSYLQVRRRSGSSSTTATSVVTTSSNSIATPASPPLDFESRDFNIGEFTATVLFLFLTGIDLDGLFSMV